VALAQASPHTSQGVIAQDSVNCPDGDPAPRLAGSLAHFLHTDFAHSGGRRPVPKAWAQPISPQYSLSLMLAGDCGADALCLPPPRQAVGKPGHGLLWRNASTSTNCMRNS